MNNSHWLNGHFAARTGVCHIHAMHICIVVNDNRRCVMPGSLLSSPIYVKRSDNLSWLFSAPNKKINFACPLISNLPRCAKAFYSHQNLFEIIYMYFSSALIIIIIRVGMSMRLISISYRANRTIESLYCPYAFLVPNNQTRGPVNITATFLFGMSVLIYCFCSASTFRNEYFQIPVYSYIYSCMFRK